MKTIHERHSAFAGPACDETVREGFNQAQHSQWALASLSLSMLLPSLNTSIANASLPTLAQTFAAPFQHVQWIVLAYLLAITTLIVSVGRLGDIAGHRRLLLAGITLFTVASLLCGAAPTLWFLVAARMVQGLGAAIMMTLSMALIGETVSKEKTGRAMGLLGTMSALGTALGPSLGGFLNAEIGWQAIFLINLPIGILVLFLTQHYLPVDCQVLKNSHATSDKVGTLLLAVTLGSYALAMTMGRGRFGLFNIALLLLAFCGVALFTCAEAKAPSPLINLAIFRDPVLTGNLTTSMLVSTVMMSTLVVGPFYLSHALGLNASRVGLILSVGPAVAALSGLPAGRLAEHFGVRRITIGGLCGIALGSFLLSVSSTTTGVPGYIFPLVVLTMGYALFQTSNNTAVMTRVLPEERGVVSGMLTLSRYLGLITGASVMGAVFSMASGTANITDAHSETVAAGMRLTFAIAAGLSLFGFAVEVGSRVLSAHCSRTN